MVSQVTHFRKNHFLNLFGAYASEELRTLIELKEWEDLRSGYAGCGSAYSRKEIGDLLPYFKSFAKKQAHKKSGKIVKRFLEIKNKIDSPLQTVINYRVKLKQ